MTAMLCPQAGDTEAPIVDTGQTPSPLDRCELDRWYGTLEQDLQSLRVELTFLGEGSALAGGMVELKTLIARLPGMWQHQWDRLTAARLLAEAFDDTCMLLVFGKFNAGKSSLCNFLADQARAQGAAVRYFHVVEGQVIDTAERLVEGVTETTARLQGVVLGQRLVLLDSPGLHSATAENAALTLRFTDCADGMLWLTSSTAPGQVQELEELSRELHRGKPLQPVLTRSDVFDEDEIDGQIKKVLCNKCPERRALQERDVAQRSAEKLRQLGVDEGLLRQPLSVSVHAAKVYADSPDGLDEAGFGGLRAALDTLVDSALHYKGGKPFAMQLHHFEECVVGSLEADLLHKVNAMIQSLQQEQGTLAPRLERLRTDAARAVILQLHDTLELHAESRNTEAAVQAVSDQLRDAFARQLMANFRDYRIELPELDAAIAINARARYDVLSAEPVAEAGAGGGTDAASAPIIGISHERMQTALEEGLVERLQVLVQAVGTQMGAGLQQTLDALIAFEAGICERTAELALIGARFRGGGRAGDTQAAPPVAR
ncbi:50S ribosome-binding GTPase [Pseudoxanthomonas sp. GM95]|uniref:GTPase n=1 Tax=Pseudoxanthomonas sp. GM95 TaxID=1881043 RepID=UPI0008D6D942|nr:GTPase [Pseudoxanthomonas sp. GM95]SEM53156.1 50S ribosome-binding GTPase [Pseudoxanthomonas sp. GM95]